MNKTELLNKLARDSGEWPFLARAPDKLELAWQRNIPACTDFSSPQERVSVENLLNARGRPCHLFLGGYEGAEHTVCTFLLDWQGVEDWQGDGESCPVCVLRCIWSGGQKLTHRDFLGSVLGLGLDREKVGDLLVADGCCDVLVLEEVADLLVFHMEQAGRIKLKCSSLPLDRLEPPAVEIRTIWDTISSLRLDAVAASGFSLSRDGAADLIVSDRVQLNHWECVKPDYAVAQGGVPSCRGLGKYVLTEVGGPSKKGRILIVLKRYVQWNRQKSTGSISWPKRPKVPRASPQGRRRSGTDCGRSISLPTGPVW